MPEIHESPLIKDVHLASLKSFGDDRGRFTETFRKEWFPQRTWDIVQTNRSESKAGVLRGLHYHFHQVDYWFVAAGRIRAAMHDLRPHSPTSGATQMLEMGEENQIGLFIPVGVAHGFVTLKDAILIYIVDNYYNGTDEHGIAWNDPELAIPWDIEAPTLSARDAANPLLKDIPGDKLPQG